MHSLGRALTLALSPLYLSSQVCSWVSETLTKEGIDGEAAIVTSFRKQGIRGQHLSMLTPELLRNELEFGTLGSRLSFLQLSD